MKNLFKIFFIILAFFITLGINNQNSAPDNFISNSNVASVINNITENLPDTGTIAIPKENENSIVQSNSQNQKILSATDRKDSSGMGSFDNFSGQNKYIKKFLSSKYYKIYLSSSHKISPYLKNEICTRAP